MEGLVRGEVEEGVGVAGGLGGGTVESYHRWSGGGGGGSDRRLMGHLEMF